MKYGSLFTGVGGFDLALDRAGFECAWQCEIDKQANQVLRRHWPNVTRYEDVTKIGSEELEPVDLICFGWPCQDLSVAGARKGIHGKRSGLFFEAVRIIDELKPRWILAENVPGLRSSNNGIDMGIVIGELEELGYMGAWASLDAQYFNVPQRRERVLFVGCLGDWRGPCEVLFEPESVCGNSPPGRETGKGVSALTSCGVRTCGADDNQAQAGHLICAQETGKGFWNQSEQVAVAFSAGQSSGARTLGLQKEQSPTLRGAASGTNQVPAVLTDSEKGNQGVMMVRRLTPL